MADENENEFEDEFDFESDDDLLDPSSSDIDESTTDYSYAGESRKPPMPVLIGIGVAVVVVIGIIVMMVSGGEEEAPPPPPPPEVVAEPTTPPVQDPWAPTGDILAQDNEDVVTPKDVIERLETQDENTKKYMIALDRKLNSFMSKINTLESRLGASNNAVNEIGNKLEAINQEMKMMAAPPPPPPSNEEKLVEREAFVSPSLSVHAIIPGRAWLKNRDGKTITVTEGDPIDGYGKVLAIDAPANKVITSSGVVLR